VRSKKLIGEYGFAMWILMCLAQRRRIGNYGIEAGADDQLRFNSLSSIAYVFSVGLGQKFS